MTDAGGMGRLSYADPRLAVWLATLLVAMAAGLHVALSAYDTASFFDSVEPRYVSDEIYYVDTARRLLQNVFHANIDYYSYSGKTSDNYYNAEHPPLGKYIIALSMLLCGDRPLCWRLPSVVEAGLIPVILWAGLALAYRGLLGPIAGAAAALAAASDPVLRVMGSVAMLDIHQAFFTALAIALVANRRLIPAFTASGLAASVKMSGGAVVIATATIAASQTGGGVGRRLAVFAAGLLIGASVYLALYAPLVLYFGPLWVVEETINALKWHTTSRPPGPPASTVIGWIVNSNPFYLSLEGRIMAATTNTIVHATALGFAAIAILVELLEKGGRPRWPGVAHVYMFFILLLYTGVYLAGNRTLYSFYSVQLTPIAAAVIGEATAAMAAWRCGWSGSRTEGSKPQADIPEATA
ncbi:glycosyltransferase family 39 protein [Aeropyrum camini]|uniref:Predicted membrane-bound dolichyl-phosphate-mannose-protein mannosyltransferase n=1 Tax=Aeropyrum camini SY1 = JCM 12091 TaxID=1198449 RepID=U3TB46_9CREN|nr:glycosyltransferase family 39 protein [Aeropyrum camini]BAN89621.1 predicted membrane-bound dolichyl-phosphate-mannose-protein mannosyltransferase [Aeropyrum camini SY1 = JCM 12091]